MNTLYRGELAGIFCLVGMIASFISTLVFGAGKSVMGDVIAFTLYLIVSVTYLMLLYAVKEVVDSFKNKTFTTRMRDFIFATAVTTLLMSPLMVPLFLSESLEQIFGLVAIVLVAILGILSIRVAPFFSKLEGVHAVYGKKAGKWIKISGWLMATVIFSFIGAFLSLVADYYLWKMVKHERLSKESK